ncbi:MAG: sensor domain-containing protein [Mycobacterium sp.]|uniref:channel accessory protein ArfC n=1 Tax=Mycobacterium sp. TaxID=1785 RepID=UPI003CC5C3EC
MNHPQWWLIVLAFVLGMVLTFALTIRRVRREVPVSDPSGRSAAGALSDAASEKTTKIPVGGETTAQIPVGRTTSTAQVTPPQWDSPRPGGRRRWPWWASVAVFSAAGVAVAATLTVTAHDRGSSTSSSTPTSTPPPTVAVPALAGLLLPAEQIADIVGVTNMSKSTGVPTLVPANRSEIAEADCVSAWNAGQHSVYAGTGETGAYSQASRADEKPLRHIADQAVIAYPNADAAGKVVAKQFAQWSGCSGRTVTLTTPPPRAGRLFTFGPVTNTSGVLSMTETSVDNAIWGCQRALAARSNVVIDIRACRPDTTNQAVGILDAIAAKIPR